MGDLFLLADGPLPETNGWDTLTIVALFALIGFVIWRVTR